MRTILVIRHGVALDRVDAAIYSVADGDRPLTRDGIRKMKKTVRGLKVVSPKLKMIITSPFLRAKQTAELVAEAYPKAKVVVSELLIPGQPPEMLLKFLSQFKSQEPLAIVGHEPDLSVWAGWAVTGKQRSLFELKKGGVCQLLFDDDLAAGKAVQGWLLTPAQLRQLGG
ncbi:MAG TPA: histidine phosphatase family protein [Mariprofundaceae bacterium]|nr:histidine phosphatase family protein [Mariprofundaceae bacterium]